MEKGEIDQWRKTKMYNGQINRYIFFIPLEESYSNVNSTIMSIHINKNNNNTKKKRSK